MIFEHQDYRDFLRKFYNMRVKQRTDFSMRSFATELAISNSFLSEVLSGKKSLSLDAAFRMALRLELNDHEIQYFCLMVQLEQEQNPEFRAELNARLRILSQKSRIHGIEADVFKAISQWYHFAILELTYLPSIELNAQNIARVLEIEKAEALAALDRLLRLGLLKVEKHGVLKKAHSRVLTESMVPNAAFKEFHLQFLDKAKKSISGQTPQERVSATDVVAIDSKYLKQIEKLAAEFSDKISKLAEKSSACNSVYALSLHFFKITKNKGQKP